MRQLRSILPLAAVFLPILAAQAPSAGQQRYALILNDAPLARQILTGLASRNALLSPSAGGRERALLNTQASLRSRLSERTIPVTGSVHTLANAVFVTASPDRLAELRALPGVAAVMPLQPLHRSLNKALDLINTTQAWSALGGAASAGAGVKIAILDSGIDETHAGFQDASLPTPAGFPKTGNADDRTHATNKIIAVRSFVSVLSFGDGSAEFSLPDDLSARDHVGHGTAMAMIAAGVSHRSPLGTISGVAPKAWLGNYKIFGSPGVNDYTSADAVLQALEAAFSDGMDVALVSAGSLPALWSPTDQGAVCGQTPGNACDLWSAAVSNAALGGMTIVVPAGNDGQLGSNTINTPGDAANVITVGATANTHTLGAGVVTPAGDRVAVRWGDGPKLTGSFSAPLATVASGDATGQACVALPAGSLAGVIALIPEGNCSAATKVINAANAGAVAVLISQSKAAEVTKAAELAEPRGLSNTGVPAGLISAASGAALKAYVGNVVNLDPASAEAAATEAVASFSSRGPNPGDGSIKPDLAAPGAGIYTAAQRLDPNGDMYNSTGYIGVDGTSFAAAFAAGAAALVRQAQPGFTPAQIKSAVVNTASAGIVDGSSAARAIAVGAGKLNIQAAVASTVAAAPVSIGFGLVKGTLPSVTLTLTNTGASAATLQLAVAQRDADSRAAVSLNPSSLSLPAGQSGRVTVSLTGTAPAAGSYEGSINVTGGAVPLRIPYLYIAADGNPFTLIPLTGSGFLTEAGTAVDLAFRVVDRFGVPVSGAPVRFSPPASISAATPATDASGIAEGYVYTAAQPGEQSLGATLQNGMIAAFNGRTRLRPVIFAGGVLDAASFLAPSGFAPGSYLTIFGTGLSENTEALRTSNLGWSLAGVSVSFDVPSLNIHVPGRLSFVSAGQISVQIPWELAAATSAVVKVTLSNSASKSSRADNVKLGTNQTSLIAIPIAAYSPAFFEFKDGAITSVAALDENFRLVSSANPVQRGRSIALFVNGLGDVVTKPASGEPAPSSAPFATTRATPIITIGGQPATVLFSGLAPGLVGLYQVNVTVPAAAGTGSQPLSLSIGGVAAKTTTVMVQ